MNLENSYKNTVSFGSIYKFNEKTKDNNETQRAIDKLYGEMDLKLDCNCFDDYLSFNEIMDTGVIRKIHISAPDKYDKYIESYLTQHNILFKKLTSQEALNPNNVYERIVLDKYSKDKNLVSLDTKKIDDLLRQDLEFYISEDGKSGTIGSRYQGVINYLKTGKEIDATKLVLTEDNGKVRASIIDGRHRFAVMRDIGLKKIKFALDDESYEIAKKYNLVNI